ncbi:MAG: MinD/ParA family protein [Pseudomonadota bacterium]
MNSEQACGGVVTIAVCSGKGGVGKTNVSVNLASALGSQGKRVLLMDADLGLGNVDLLLGLRSNQTLLDVVEGNATLMDIVIDGPPGVKIVPAPSGSGRMASLSSLDHASLVRAFGELPLDPEFLIVDVAAGVGADVIAFCSAVQHVVVVACDEPASLADAYGLIKVANRAGVKRVYLLANMMRSEKQAYGLYQKLLTATDRFLSVSVVYLGMIPQDESLRRAVQHQWAVVHRYPASKSARAFHEVASRLQSLAPPVAAHGRLEFFMEKMFNQQGMAR